MDAHRLITERERRVVEASLTLLGHRSLRAWTDSREDLSYATVQKALSGATRPGPLVEEFAAVVRQAGLKGRLEKNGAEGPD